MSNKNIDQFISKPLGNTVVQQRRHHALQTSASSFGKGGWEGGDGKFWRNFFVTFAFQVFAVNVFSQFWCIYEFLPRMLTLNMVKNSLLIMMDNIDTLAIWSPQGHIVSMSSMAGVTGTPNLVPYCASKVFCHVAPLSANFFLKEIDNDNFLVCSEGHDGGPLSWAEGRQPWFKGTWFHTFQYLFWYWL